MTHERIKLVIAIFFTGCVAILLLAAAIFLTGCGSVTLSDDAGVTDTATGSGDVRAMMKPEVHPDVPDVVPEAPPPGRPLGAGCADDTQCGSGICVNDPNGIKICCDGRPDACNVCTGGYKTPVKDGTTCGADVACSGSDRKWNACSAGVCVPQIIHCATAVCDRGGQRLCLDNHGGCDLGDDPCYCLDAVSSGHISYPCAM